jgi:predicted alpha/beta-fold hydrolase
VTDRFPEAAVRIDRSRVMAATTFFAFDDAATAPLHGFDGAGDYYARCSSTRFLSRISVPTLCLNSMDDPFLPEGAIQVARSMASSAVHFLTTQRGGHAGFVGRSSNGVVYWAEEEGLRWLRQAVE